jgi:hypothetical protein
MDFSVSKQRPDFPEPLEPTVTTTHNVVSINSDSPAFLVEDSEVEDKVVNSAVNNAENIADTQIPLSSEEVDHAKNAVVKMSDQGVKTKVNGCMNHGKIFLLSRTTGQMIALTTAVVLFISSAAIGFSGKVFTGNSDGSYSIDPLYFSAWIVSIIGCILGGVLTISRVNASCDSGLQCSIQCA